MAQFWPYIFKVLPTDQIIVSSNAEKVNQKIVLLLSNRKNKQWPTHVFTWFSCFLSPCLGVYQYLRVFSFFATMFVEQFVCRRWQGHSRDALGQVWSMHLNQLGNFKFLWILHLKWLYRLWESHYSPWVFKSKSRNTILIIFKESVFLNRIIG